MSRPDPGVGATADGGATIDSSANARAHGGTSVARSIAIAGQRSSFRHFFLTSTPAFHARVYVRVDQPVTGRTMFLLLRRSSAVPAIAWLTIEPGNIVRPRVWASDWPASVTLTTGQWHRFDIFVDERPASGQHVLQLALDGNTFVLAENQAFSHIVDTLEVGLNVNAEAVGAGAMSFDDVAVNGTVGPQENGFPGPGRIFVLRPNGQAGAAQWAKSDGGAAAADNWVEVSELTPDDGASALTASTNQNTTDEYEVDAPRQPVRTLVEPPLQLCRAINPPPSRAISLVAKDPHPNDLLAFRVSLHYSGHFPNRGGTCRAYD